MSLRYLTVWICSLSTHTHTLTHSLFYFFLHSSLRLLRPRTIKILTSFLQLLSSFSVNVGIEWPFNYKNLMLSFQFINIDPGAFVSGIGKYLTILKSFSTRSRT